MAPSLLTLPVPELPGLLREALRSALRHLPGDEVTERILIALANTVARSLVLAATGRVEPPTLTSGQLLTLVTALDAVREKAKEMLRGVESLGLHRGHGAVDNRALSALIDEQTQLIEAFDALMVGGDEPRASGPDFHLITTTGPVPQGDGTIGVDIGRDGRPIFVEVKAGESMATVARRVADAINAGRAPTDGSK